MQKLIETVADQEIQECLEQKRSFAVIAGAGSGKTTSLITALKYVKRSVGKNLLRDNKQIVCITYTKRAVEVISSRLDWDELYNISTLHSFLWGEVHNLTPNIREALRTTIIPAHIERKKEDANGGQSKKAVAAREKIAALEADLGSLDAVENFGYNDTKFSIFSEGKLGHDDVIDVAAHLISEHEVLRRILGQKYPYIFVDEAQDTFSNVVDALNILCQNNSLPLVGYFGDPMQQIYDKRAGNFSGPDGAATITKGENFRCSLKVIDLLNAFRKDVQQIPAGKNADIEGSVLFRLVQAEDPEAPRRRYSSEQLDRVAGHFDEALRNWDWAESKTVKQLFLVRQMIARRLGFPELHKLFTGKYASSKAQEDYEKGEHFLLKPFINSLHSLVQARNDGDIRLVLEILRKTSPTFDPNGTNERRPLSEMRALAEDLSQKLVEIWGKNSLREILKFCQQNKVCEISDRLASHLGRDSRNSEYDEEQHLADKSDWLADSFFEMTTREIGVFIEFVNKNTPLSTQHGVKGEEYSDVVVVFDDVEAGWHNYSFTKMLTPGTSGEPTEGQEDRSRKLAYVCFSQAEVNLRILLFTPNPEAAKLELISNGLCTEDQITIA